VVEDRGAKELNLRYFGGRTDGLQLMGGVGRVMWARAGM
jgi:hypothetical protein